MLAEPQLYKWCFQQQGKLKLQFVEHIKADEPSKPNPHLYRIKDQAIYTIGYLNLSMESGSHLRLKTKNQLQLSFKMLDPYQRLNLKPLGPVSAISNSTELDTYAYFVNFTVPDHHGMFTLNWTTRDLGYPI